MAGTARKTRKSTAEIDESISTSPANSVVVTKTVTAPAISKPVVVSNKNAARESSATPDQTEIALRAWEIWQREGCPEGRDLDHWLRAEQELRASR